MAGYVELLLFFVTLLAIDLLFTHEDCYPLVILILDQQVNVLSSY